ncbi:hypothetical protein WDV93_16740 [Pantoea ananatis]
MTSAVSLDLTGINDDNARSLMGQIVSQIPGIGVISQFGLQICKALLR